MVTLLQLQALKIKRGKVELKYDIMEEFELYFWVCLGSIGLLCYAIAKRKIGIGLLAVLMVVLTGGRLKVLGDEEDLQRKRNEIELRYKGHLASKRLRAETGKPAPFGPLPDRCCDIFCDCHIKRSELVDAEMHTCPCGHPTSWHFDY